MTAEKQEKVVDLMIRLYCHKKHGTKKKELCAECQELTDYCHHRLSLCPFMKTGNKPFCSNCRIHCYDKDHRERIRVVMRFSGPRMIFHHPILAFSHVIQSKRQKRKMAKEAKMKEKEKSKDDR